MLNFHWQSSLGRCGRGLGWDSNSAPGENSSNFLQINMPQNFNRILGCPEFSDPVVPSERADPGNNLPSEQLSNMNVSNIILIRGTSANEDKSLLWFSVYCNKILKIVKNWNHYLNPRHVCERGQGPVSPLSLLFSHLPPGAPGLSCPLTPLLPGEDGQPNYQSHLRPQYHLWPILPHQIPAPRYD